MVKKINPAQRRKEIKLKIENDRGIHNLNYTELGKQYGVSHQVISSDVKLILSKSDKNEIGSKTAILEMAMSKALKSAMKTLDTATDNKTRLNASKIISDITVKAIGSLERMGYKISQDYSNRNKKINIEKFKKYLGSCNFSINEIREVLIDVYGLEKISDFDLFFKRLREIESEYVGSDSQRKKPVQHTSIPKAQEDEIEDIDDLIQDEDKRIEESRGEKYEEGQDEIICEVTD